MRHHLQIWPISGDNGPYLQTTAHIPGQCAISTDMARICGQRPVSADKRHIPEKWAVSPDMDHICEQRLISRDNGPYLRIYAILQDDGAYPAARAGVPVLRKRGGRPEVCPARICVRIPPVVEGGAEMPNPDEGPLS